MELKLISWCLMKSSSKWPEAVCDGYHCGIHSAIYFLLNRRISYQDFNFWRVNIFPSIFFHYYYICLSGGLVSAAFHNYFNGKNYLKERFSLYDKIEKHASSTMNFFRISGTNICIIVCTVYLFWSLWTRIICLNCTFFSVFWCIVVV